MATPNYNLPTISGNMAADVVRDMNALAEATDSAIKEAIDNVDLSAVDTKISTHLADDVNHIRSAVDTGTANAKVVTLNPVPTMYKDLMGITFKNAVQNTGAVTINVHGLGAKSIVKSNGSALTSGFLKVGSIYTVRYNATTGNFILQGEGGSGNAQPNEVLTGKTFTNDSGEFVGTAKKSGLRIKNYQSGIAVIEVSNLKTSIPISPVISGNTIIKVSYSPSSPSAYSAHVLGYLSGNSVVELVRNGQYNSVDSNLIFWEAIEFESTVNVVYGTTTLTTGTNWTVATSPYSWQESLLFFSYNGSSNEGLKSLIGGFQSGNAVGGKRSEVSFFSRNDLTSMGKFMQIQYYIVDLS